MRGVPLRIEIGPRDVLRESVVISRRDVPGKQGKVFGISMEASILVAYVKDKLDENHSSLLGKAISFRDSNIVDVNSYNQLKDAISQGKWARGPWSARWEKGRQCSIRLCFTLMFTQDQGLEVISEGLDKLNDKAHDLNEASSFNGRIDTKVDNAASDLKNTNVRLEDTVNQRDRED
ncbi:unnamed protein product [Camellia sinensis]